MLIKEVFSQFLSEQKSNLAPKTYRDYASVIDLFANQLDGYGLRSPRRPLAATQPHPTTCLLAYHDIAISNEDLGQVF